MESGTKWVASDSHFVFVHGAMHGAWCWYKIRSGLEALGHRVSCLDLAGAGINQSNPETITTFAEYNKPLIDFMSQLAKHEKVILVGHSVGGLSITYAINEFWNKISLAIYVCAAMVPSTTAGARDPSVLHKYELTANTVLLKEEYQRDLFYHLSPIEDSILASMLLRPFPIRASIDAANMKIGADANKVKRVYIKTLCDQKFDLQKQDQTIAAWPPSLVLTVESEHSPFFSTPDTLIKLLLEAVGPARGS